MAFNNQPVPTGMEGPTPRSSPQTFGQLELTFLRPGNRLANEVRKAPGYVLRLYHCARARQVGGSEMAEGTAFSSWKYAHYFEFVGGKKGRNITVSCKLCPGNKSLSTATNSTSNLKKHLQTKHSSTALVAARPAEEEDDAAGGSDARAPKQQRLAFNSAKAVTPREINELVAGYVVEEMLPLSTVESPTFRKIIRKIPMTGNKEGTVSDRKTFASYLDKAYSDMEKELKTTFECLEYVSTTADLWTANNKSFMGMTAHWIHPSSLQRMKAAIACRRVRGRHTYDIVAGEIEQIHASYGLTGKVTATVTDNGSNFVKAFQVYQKSGSDSEAEEEVGDEEVTFEDLHDMLSGRGGEDNSNDFVLPPHHRCASHTLNLICTTDIEKWLSSNTETKSVYRSAVAKCSGLWTKASRSTVASELAEKFSRRKLLVPTTTRWNSFYDALSRVTDIPITDLSNLCTQLGIRCITDREYQFIKEYCMVLKPLTMALDILQGEDNCFYGTVLPTLEALMAKTLGMKHNLSRMTSGLPDVIVKAIKTRFASTLDSKEALLAAVTIPKFKLRWIRGEAEKDNTKMLLAAECRALPAGEPPQDLPPPAPVSGGDADSDFFAFDTEDSHTVSESVDTEIMEYLKSGVEMDVLNKFPMIKKIFLRVNTPVPSSAPVERLFSLGSLVLTPRRNRLSDARFEKLLLMRYNRSFGVKE